jgi:nucleoid-associated protein YgaU
VPAGSAEVKPYKVVQDDTLWSIATNWIRKYALIDAPTDDQITSFVKQIVKSTNSLSNFKGLDLPGADTQIKDPNLIKPGMIFYLPIDKTEILKVYK